MLGAGHPRPLLSEISMPGKVGWPRCCQNTAWRRRGRNTAAGGLPGLALPPLGPNEVHGEGGEDLVDRTLLKNVSFFSLKKKKQQQPSFESSFDFSKDRV